MSQSSSGKSIRPQLSPCPTSPNCVSSQATESSQHVEPFRLALPTAEAWQSLITILKASDRTVITEQKDNYLHAKVTSLIFRFVDDFEFLLDPAQKIIHIRSASRTGHSDLGVNRKRVEALRQQLKAQGVIL